MVLFYIYVTVYWVDIIDKILQINTHLNLISRGDYGSPI